MEVPFQAITTCVRMKQAVCAFVLHAPCIDCSRTTLKLPRCNKAMEDSCIDRFDPISCRAAVAFCDAELSTGYWASGGSLFVHRFRPIVDTAQVATFMTYPRSVPERLNQRPRLDIDDDPDCLDVHRGFIVLS